ncbi:MAG: HAD-IB family phosphatase [Elusimicrobiales bacterium]|jgi:2-hydroxy-3-keto-5-methylthiopentenyl-1-phosphate phosphatase|nr:HAD-IB family phosphatase [Elusimicrobiales bacterium]NLH38593.1 HAD-IB family phosphatase [Elusimicrobiota bacterium]
MKFALVSDFDGTITTRDVGDFLLLHFGLAAQKEIDESYAVGMRVEEWMKKYFRRMKYIDGIRIKKAISDHIRIRRGFRELVDFFNKNNYPLEVVSGGVDLYIDEVFGSNGIKINGFYGRFNSGDIKFDFLKKLTLSDFKASRVKHYKKLGYKTIFCGDATNDYRAAKEADVVFAALKLKDILSDENFPFYPLNNFRDVVGAINATLSH